MECFEARERERDIKIERQRERERGGERAKKSETVEGKKEDSRRFNTR